MPETRLTTNNRYMPQEQPFSSYISHSPENREDIDRRIAQRTLELALFNEQGSCPHCGNLWRKHPVLACGWYPGEPDPDPTLAKVGYKLRERQYGQVKCKRCHTWFESHAPNTLRCDACRQWLRKHRNG